MEKQKAYQSGEWICIRNCYYLDRYWKAGENLHSIPGFEDAPPGKHFALNGIVPRDEIQQITRPGDDPRSTDQIRRDIEKNFPHVKIPENADRKKLFNLWMDAEKTTGENAKEEPKRATKPDAETDAEKTTVEDAKEKRFKEYVAEAKAEAAKDPLDGKNFSALTPDEVDRLKPRDIAQAVKARFGVEMRYNGVSKSSLIQQALQYETH
jgi:hypothetical protein